MYIILLLQCDDRDIEYQHRYDCHVSDQLRAKRAYLKRLTICISLGKSYELCDTRKYGAQTCIAPQNVHTCQDHARVHRPIDPYDIGSRGSFEYKSMTYVCATQERVGNVCPTPSPSRGKAVGHNRTHYSGFTVRTPTSTRT